MLMSFCFTFAEYIHTYIHKASDPRNMQFPICTLKKNRDVKWDNCLIAQAGKQRRASPGCNFIGLDQVMSTSISMSNTGLSEELFFTICKAELYIDWHESGCKFFNFSLWNYKWGFGANRKIKNIMLWRLQLFHISAPSCLRLLEGDCDERDDSACEHSAPHEGSELHLAVGHGGQVVHGLGVDVVIAVASAARGVHLPLPSHMHLLLHSSCTWCIFTFIHPAHIKLMHHPSLTLSLSQLRVRSARRHLSHNYAP